MRTIDLRIENPAFYLLSYTENSLRAMIYLKISLLCSLLVCIITGNLEFSFSPDGFDVTSDTRLDSVHVDLCSAKCPLCFIPQLSKCCPSRFGMSYKAETSLGRCKAKVMSCRGDQKRYMPHKSYTEHSRSQLTCPVKADKAQYMLADFKKVKEYTC